MSSTAIDPSKQSQSYSFLPKILKDDLAALRTAVQLASKAEKTCPLAQKPARVAEREMLELELGKLRTKIERGEREAKEREVMAGHKKEENLKRKEGKGAWYLKKSSLFTSSRMRTILTIRRPERVTAQSSIRASQRTGWSEGCQKSDREEEEEDCKQGEEVEAFCKGSRGTGSSCWWRRGRIWWWRGGTQKASRRLICLHTSVWQPFYHMHTCTRRISEMALSSVDPLTVCECGVKS